MIRKALPLSLLVLVPVIARANMNGGLHIDPAVIAGIFALFLLVVISFFLSLWNLSRKSRGIRIFNIIVWVPLFMAACWVARASLLWPLLLPVLQALLILGSRSGQKPLTDNHETV